MTLTLNSFGVTTFYYSDSAYICPQGVTGKIIKELKNRGTTTVLELIIAENDIIPKCQPLIIYGTPNTTYEFVPIDSDVPIVKTILRGKDENNLMPNLVAYDHLVYMVLSAVDGKIGWNPYDKSTISKFPVHRCFFIYNKNEDHSDQKSAGLIEGFSYVPIK